MVDFGVCWLNLDFGGCICGFTVTLIFDNYVDYLIVGWILDLVDIGLDLVDIGLFLGGDCELINQVPTFILSLRVLYMSSNPLSGS